MNTDGHKDVFAIAWATNSSLVLTNLALDAGGNYSVVVSNPGGSVTFSLFSFHPSSFILKWWVDTSIDVTAGNNPRRFYRVVAVP